MSKTLQESKRSIHSTRIDVIAGELTPIKPVDSLPINTVQRPKVEDPEYKPDTAAELAAALSALARLVPPEQAPSIYIAIRELIEKIIPITHTSLDMLGEGKYTALDMALEDEALRVRIEVEKRIGDLRRQNSEYADAVVDRLNDFGAKLYALIRSAAPKKGERAPTERDLRPIVTALNSLLDQYKRTLDRESQILPDAADEPPEITSKDTKFDAINRGQILDAFRRRITALRASGDSFDLEVARATERRLSIVTEIMRKIKLVSPREAAEMASQQRQQQRVEEPTPPDRAPTLSSSRLSSKSGSKWNFEEGTELPDSQELQDFVASAIAEKRPLLIKYTGQTTGKKYYFIEPTRVAKNREGSLVVVARDVSPDFDAFFAMQSVEGHIVTARESSFPFSRIGYAQIVDEEQENDFRRETSSPLQEAAQSRSSADSGARPLKSLYDAITKNIEELNLGRTTHSSFSMKLTPRRGAPSGFYDIFLQPEFVPGRIREYPTDKEVKFNPDFDKSELIAGHGHIHVYRRFIQTFDGKDIEIQPDVRVDFAAIAKDAIIAITDQLRREGVDDAEKQAVDFFEENRYYIIKDAINPERIPAPSLPGEDRGYNAILTAFTVANKYVDQTFSMDIDHAETRNKWSLNKISSLARSLEREASTSASPDERDRSQRLRDSVRQMERQVAAISKGKYDPASRESYGRLKSSRLEEERIIKIRRELRNLTSIEQGPIAVELARIENASFESFSAISSLDVKKISEMKSDFDVSTTHPITRIPEPTPKARADVVAQRVNALIEKAKASAAKLSPVARDALRSDLLSALRAVVETRQQAADRGIAAARSLDPMFESDLDTVHADLVSAVTQLREIRQTVSAANTSRIKTLESVLDLFAKVAQLAPNNEGTSHDFADVKAATRLVAEGSIQRLIETVLDQDGLPNDPELSTITTGLAFGTEEQHLLSLVGNVAAILHRVYPGKRARDLIGDGSGPAFSFFGCTADMQMPPIFADGDLATLLNASSLVKGGDISVLSPSVCEALFKIDAGTLQKMGSSLRGAKPNDAASSALAFSESLFRDVIEDALGDSFPVLEGLQLIVYLASHLTETGFKNTQTAEELTRNQIVDSVEDAMIAGTYGTLIDINSLTRKAFSQYAVSVDRHESGVGFFVDTSGMPVARVVGSADTEVLGRETGAQRRSSLIFARSLVCIDPKLTELAQRAFDAIVTTTGETIREQVDPADEDIAELISDAARDAILQQMQKSAARVNSSLSINPTQGFIDDTDTPDTKDGDAINKFIAHNERIMKDARRTKLARMVAAAAINYVGHAKKLPAPGVGLQYYTRVKTDDHTDPDTGMPLLKQGHDFVLKTLPASVKHPMLEVYKGQLTSSRDRFLSTIMQLVDDHILTELHDPFGVIKPFVNPKPEDLVDIEDPEEDKKKKKKKENPRKNKYSKNAFNYVNKVLLPDQAANALTLMQGQIRRSPFQIKFLPVLSVTSVIKSGMSTDELNKVFAEARDFVVGMMIARGLGGGYIRTDTRLTEAQIKDISPSSEAARNILSDVGEQILQAVENHIAEKIHNAEGGSGVTVGQGDEAERLTQSQVAGRLKQVGRAEIIGRIAAEHYRAIGMEDPVQLFYDKKTGLPSMPPEPAEFFRARGIKTSNDARIVDPVQHAMQVAIAYDEYRRHVSEMMGIAAPSMSGFLQGQADLAKSFPEVLAAAKESAQMADSGNVYTYSHETLPALNYDATIGSIIEIEGPAAQDPGESRDVGRKLARLQTIFASAQGVIASFETYANKSRFSRVFSGVWARIERQIANVKVFVDSFQRQVEKLVEANQAAPDRLPPEMSRTLLSLSNAYGILFTTFNTQCANEMQRLENEARLKASAKLTAEGIVAACQQMLNNLRQSGENDKFESLRKIAVEMGITVADSKGVISLSMPEKKEEEEDEQRDAAGLPILSGADAPSLVHELSKWRKEQVENITKVYEKSSRAAGIAHEHIDAEIRLKAKSVAPDVSRLLGTKIKPEVKIFETFDDLVSFANELSADHTSTLLRHMKNVESESARAQIDASVKSYLTAVLGSSLYAVRTPPNRTDDADAS